MLKERNYEGDEYDEWVRLGKLTAARLAWVIVDPNGVITELCPKGMTKGAKSVAMQLAYTLTLCLDVHRNDRNINVVEERLALGVVFMQHDSIPALKMRSAWVLLDPNGVIIALCEKGA